jgi:uncharacterized protein YbaA (DUF1428 family)
MGSYVDGFVIPMKKKNVAAYKKMAKLGCKAWLKHGALDYYECVSDDLAVPCGGTFPKAYKLKADEVLVFAYIVFKSKAHRNSVNKKVHAEMAKLFSEDMAMPFDMKRFSYGGFKTLVSKR